MSRVQKLIALITIGAVTNTAHYYKIPITTLYLIQKLKHNTNTTINIKIPSWYQYAPDSTYPQEKFIQLLINAITEKKLILTEQIANLICDFAAASSSSFEIHADLHHQLILFYASHPTLFKHSQVHKLCTNDNIDTIYFNLLTKYPDDMHYLRYLSNTLMLRIIEDIASDKPDITITSKFATEFVTELITQDSDLTAMPNAVTINSALFQKLIEANPKVMKYLGKSTIFFLCSDLYTESSSESDIDNFLFNIIVNYPEIRKYVCPSLLSDSLFNKIYEYETESTDTQLETIMNIMQDFNNCYRIIFEYIDFKTDPEETVLIIIEKFPSLINFVLNNYVILTEDLYNKILEKNPKFYDQLQYYREQMIPF